MKLKLFTLFLTITTLGCAIAKFSPDPMSEEYPERIPCEAKVVVKLDKADKEYIFIGTCKTKGTSGANMDNIALAKIRKCACKYGGDIIRLIKHKETFYQDVYSTYKDELTGEVYRLK